MEDLSELDFRVVSPSKCGFVFAATLFHLTIKFVLSGILRLFLSSFASGPRVTLTWDVYCRRVASTGITSSFDIGKVSVVVPALLILGRHS